MSTNDIPLKSFFKGAAFVVLCAATGAAAGYGVRLVQDANQAVIDTKIKLADGVLEFAAPVCAQAGLPQTGLRQAYRDAMMDTNPDAIMTLALANIRVCIDPSFFRQAKSMLDDPQIAAYDPATKILRVAGTASVDNSYSFFKDSWKANLSDNAGMAINAFAENVIPKKPDVPYTATIGFVPAQVPAPFVRWVPTAKP